MTEIDGPKHENSVNLDFQVLTLLMDSVQFYDTDHYEIHNNMDGEHSEVWFDSVRLIALIWIARGNKAAYCP